MAVQIKTIANLYRALSQVIPAAYAYSAVDPDHPPTLNELDRLELAALEVLSGYAAMCGYSIRHDGEHSFLYLLTSADGKLRVEFEAVCETEEYPCVTFCGKIPVVRIINLPSVVTEIYIGAVELWPDKGVDVRIEAERQTRSDYADDRVTEVFVDLADKILESLTDTEKAYIISDHRHLIETVKPS